MQAQRKEVPILERLMGLGRGGTKFTPDASEITETEASCGGL